MAIPYNFTLKVIDEENNVYNNEEQGYAELSVGYQHRSIGPTYIQWSGGGRIDSLPGERYSVNIPKNTFADGVNIEVTITQWIFQIYTEEKTQFSVTRNIRTPKNPVAKNCYPNQGFINYKTISTFGWEYYYEYNDFFKPFRSQTKADFKWRVKGSTVEKRINNFATTQQKGTVPASTFPKKSIIEWSISLSAQDTVGDWSPWYEVNTNDAIPTAPTRLQPNGEFFESGKAITLTWNHNISTDSPQYAFDLDISRDNGGSWIPIAAHAVTSTQKYVMQADTLNSGKTLWRVRTYNIDNVASPWSDPAQFILVGAPKAPAITSIETGKSRPTVVWNSLEQESAQLVLEQDNITIYDSGDIFGGVSAHKVEKYLADGAYTVKVRVKNAYDIWSDWTAAAHTIATTKRFTVTLTGIQIKNGVQLTFQPVENGGG